MNAYFSPDTLDVPHYQPRPDSTQTAQMQRENAALKTKVDELEGTLGLRVTIGLLLLIAGFVLRLK